VPTKQYTIEDLIAITDEALYNSKHNGRNQVNLGNINTAQPNRKDPEHLRLVQ